MPFCILHLETLSHSERTTAENNIQDHFMNVPTVSVIMPAYNHELYVGEAIESILSQSFGNFEFIILNDGSTDDTEKVVKTFRDNRIRYYSHANMDAANTINKGLSLAVGKYVSIINSDDVYDKNRLAFLHKTAEETDTVLLTTGMKTIDGNSKLLEDKWYDSLLEFYRQTGSFELTLLQGNIARTTSNFFALRNLFAEIGVFRNYRYAHDYDLILRALVRYRSKVRFFPEEPLLYYRIHGNNTVSEAPPKVRQECLAIFYELLPYLMDDDHDRERLDILCQRFSNFQQEINDYYQKQLAQKDELLLRKDSILNDVYTSKSWKLIAPLRRGYEALNKILN
jgi:glycosyltransferase involved in cell wall biosynthesis